MDLGFEFLNNYVFMVLKIVFISANIADPDDMQLYAAFHLFLVPGYTEK